MSHSDNEKDKDDFVNFRLSKLEEAVTALVQNLNTLKDIVVRWDSKISDGNWPPKCALHHERQEQVNKRMDAQEVKMENMNKEIIELKSIIWKASGALIVLSIVVQLLGPVVIQKVFSDNKPTIELIEK
jgi:hypothetical protein